jgi:hypothetical protein
MTQDEIIEMARFAGIRIDSFGFQGGFIEEFEAFAKLVAAKATAVEREACAKLIDPTEEHRKDASWGYLGGNEGVEMLDELSALIRARGEA